MIKVFCYKCKKELDRPGALIITNPTTYFGKDDSIVNYYDVVYKLHLCIDCYSKVFHFMNQNEHGKT